MYDVWLFTYYAAEGRSVVFSLNFFFFFNADKIHLFCLNRMYNMHYK